MHFDAHTVRVEVEVSLAPSVAAQTGGTDERALALGRRPHLTPINSRKSGLPKSSMAASGPEHS